MDGENNGKPYEQMDDLGGPPLYLETPIYLLISPPTCLFRPPYEIHPDASGAGISRPSTSCGPVWNFASDR